MLNISESKFKFTYEYTRISRCNLILLLLLVTLNTFRQTSGYQYNNFSYNFEHVLACCVDLDVVSFINRTNIDNSLYIFIYIKLKFLSCVNIR